MNKQLVIVLALIALLLGPTPLLAGAPYYPLIVNGSPNIDAKYDKGVVTLGFRRTRQGAGKPRIIAIFHPARARGLIVR